MSSPREKVLQLVADGKVSAAEGAELLRSLERPRRSRWKFLLNPFEVLRPPVAWALCVLGLALSAVMVAFGVRFDGALDVHASPHPSTWKDGLDLFAAWTVLAACLFGASRLARGKARLTDSLLVVGIARMALVPVAVLARLMPQPKLPLSEQEQLHLLALAVPVLPLVGLFFVLLVLGFRTASGLRGLRLGVTVTLAIIVAELITKTLTAFL